MKLPAIISRGPAAKIEAAQVLLAAAETRIGQLNTERAAALVGDSVEEVIRLDRLIDEQRRAAIIHRDRIAALEVEGRRHDWQRRERERTAAIDKTLEPFAAECADMAAELAKALGTAFDLFQRLEIKRAVMLENWPTAVPRPRFYTMHFDFLQRNLFQAHTSWDGSRFVREAKSRLPKIAASVRDHLASYIKLCRDVSIVPDEFAVTPEAPADDETEAA
jgi:hypothetical protein